MDLFEINNEMICLDKVVRFSKVRGKDRLLDEYHPFGESTYRANPYPYCIEIVFINGNEMHYKYRAELERDEVFDKLLGAFNQKGMNKGVEE